MSEATDQDLSSVSETLLIPLCYRAIETQRPDTLIKDEKAVELVKQLSSNGPIRYDSDWIKQTPMAEANKVLRIMLTREMDRYARDFLNRHPEAVVVHIGCGLDSRFDRVCSEQPDNGQVEWYDLDVPDVIGLRRKLIGDEGGHYHLLGCSVLEDAWLEAVKVHSPCRFLFLAEGVFMYFTEAQVKSLVLTLRDHFPGAELVFDGWRPFEIWLGNFVLGGLLRWGLWRGQELEGWGNASSTGASIRLLDEWGYFDRPEPRLDPFRWMAPFFRLFKPMRIFHFQLGEAARQNALLFAHEKVTDMSGTTKPNLSGVAETLLITLYIRAMESQRPNAPIKDERAEALVRQLDQETLQKTLALTDDFSRVAVILKSREFDRFTQDFLTRHPDAVVVHIGCGLDTRFERVDNGQVEWYDLDLPDVIELRRKLVGGEGTRHHFLACSVFDSDWRDVVSVHRPRPFLFLAEGLFMYFQEAQVKSLVLTMKEYFPGAELVFDAYSPFLRWAHNLRVARKRIGAPLHWALKHAQDLECWGDGIRLIEAWYPFQYSEPRLRRVLKVRFVPFLATGIGVFHYQL